MTQNQKGRHIPQLSYAESLKSPSSTNPSSNDRLLFLASKLVGKPVTATLTDNTTIEGIFEFMSVKQEESQALYIKVGAETRKVLLSEINHFSGRFSSQQIDQPKIKTCNISKTASKSVSAGPRLNPHAPEFKTDHDISKNKNAGKERDLQKWIPEGNIEYVDLDSPHNGWDQFAVNEKLFGVKTDFDEEIYTTKLDRTAKNFHIKEQQAQKLAEEVMKGSTTNIHVREERGFIDETMDEEDRYGAVVRNQHPSLQRYVPPALRNCVGSQESVKSSSSETSGTSTPRRKFSVIQVEKSDTRTGRKYSIQLQPEELTPEIEKRALEMPIKVAKEFKEFSASEKEILGKKKEEIMKRERSEKLKEFKSFSASLKYLSVDPDAKPVTKTKLNVKAAEFKPSFLLNSFLGSRGGKKRSFRNAVCSSFKQSVNNEYQNTWSDNPINYLNVGPSEGSRTMFPPGMPPFYVQG